MATEWFYQDGDKTLGPIPQAEMARRTQQGDIAPFTPVRRGNQQDWIMIEEAAELWESSPNPANQTATQTPSSPSKGFNPYTSWLGIPQEQQPVDFYSLLGLAPFESDPQRIQAAAQQQVSKVQSSATEKQLKIAKRVRNEINQAKECLLDAQKKPRYDQKLRSLKPSLGAASGPSLQNPPPLPQAPAQQPQQQVIHLTEEDEGKPWFLQPAMLVAGIGGLVVLMGLIVFVALSFSGSEDQLAENQPPSVEPVKAETPPEESPIKTAEVPQEPAEPVAEDPSPEPAAVELDTAGLSQQVQPSLVRIVGLSFSGVTHGNGIILEKGAVLTNYSLVQKAAKVEVVLPNGSKSVADGFYAAHPELDLVLLHVDDLQGNAKPLSLSVDVPTANEPVALIGFSAAKDAYLVASPGTIQQVTSGKSLESRLNEQIGGTVNGKPIEYSPSALWLTGTSQQSTVATGGVVVNQSGQVVGTLAHVSENGYLGLASVAMQDAISWLENTEDPPVNPLRTLKTPQVAARPTPLNPRPLNPSTTPNPPATGSKNPPVSAGQSYDPKIYERMVSQWHSKFSEMHSKAVDLRTKWDEQARKVESHQEELRPIIARVRSLRTQIQQLEASIRREEVEAAQAQASARNSDDPGTQDFYARIFRRHKTRADQYRLEQRNLLGQLQTKEAEGQEVQNKLNSATALAQQYTAQFDQLSYHWLLNCDLFGKYGREAHEQNVQRMTQLAERENRIITPYLASATSYLQLGKYQEALADLNTALGLDERPMTQAVLLSLRGHTQFLAGDERKALMDLGNAIKLSDGKAALALLFRAEVQAARGRHKQAGDDFRKAARLAEDSYLVHMRHAYFLATCPVDTYRNPEVAKTSAEEACKLCQDQDWNALLSLGLACAALEEFSQAAEHLQKARSLAPPEKQTELQNRIAAYQSGRIYD